MGRLLLGMVTLFHSLNLLIKVSLYFFELESLHIFQESFEVGLSFFKKYILIQILVFLPNLLLDM